MDNRELVVRDSLLAVQSDLHGSTGLFYGFQFNYFHVAHGITRLEALALLVLHLFGA
jgi:hypothetical protein